MSDQSCGREFVKVAAGAALGASAAALDYAGQNIRINAVCPGYIDTTMMGRFTGDTPEGRAKVIAEEPVGRWASPRRSPRPSSDCARSRPPSSSGTPWSWTAAKRCSSMMSRLTAVRGRIEGEDKVSCHGEALAREVQTQKARLADAIIKEMLK